ncbi:MAG: hypothetical protein IPN39_06290 [Chitinophagaceae bacterium]|nr:hypothetical protein [Chitinophagaceae bacterium]
MRKRELFRLIFTAFVFFLANNSYSQSGIDKQIKELFFELSYPSTRYEIKKALNSSDNFSDVHDVSIFEGDYESITADFKNNFKLSQDSKAINKDITFFFKKKSDINLSWVMSMNYKKEDVSQCSSQFDELMKFFKPISYKTTVTPLIIDGITVGELFHAYTSQKAYQSNNYYLELRMVSTAQNGKAENLPQGEYYFLRLDYEPRR